MSYESQRADLEGHFKTGWAASAYAAKLVGYLGHTFEFTKDDISVRLKMGDGEAQQISMGDPGGNLVRHVGVLFAQIATPGGKGLYIGDPVADVICDMFRNQMAGGVRCRIPYIMDRFEEPPNLITVVAIPFERDEYNG